MALATITFGSRSRRNSTSTHHTTARPLRKLRGLAAPLAALARLANGVADTGDFDVIGERWDLAARLRTALDAAGLDHLESDTLAKTLSGGELARVTLIGALVADAGLLVLDEPTERFYSYVRYRPLVDRARCPSSGASAFRDVSARVSFGVGCSIWKNKGRLRSSTRRPYSFG